MADGIRQVEYIAKIDEKSNLKSLWVRLEDKEGLYTINVDKIVEQEVKKIFISINNPAGRLFQYKWRSIIEGLRGLFKLMFDNNNCKWYLMWYKHIYYWGDIYERRW